MASIEQAIAVLFDPRQPEHLKKSAIELTELAKQDPYFYKFVIQKILELNQDPKCSVSLYFWYFQALEEKIQKSYSAFQEPIHREMQKFLIEILENRIDILQVHIGILNKFALLYVRVIQEDFPILWPDAFLLLIRKAQTSLYTKLFLSVLKIFSEEFTEELSYLTQDQLKKSNLLKDALREGVLIQAADLWKQILASQDFELASGTLQVMVSYIKWIPLEVTLSFFPYFVQYLSSEHTQIPALQCIDSIVNKKMDPSKKLQLIRDLHLIEFIKNSNFEDLDMLSDLPKNVAMLVDSLGEHLLDCDVNPELEVVLQCGLKCLNSTDPLISGMVFGFMSKFVRILRNREHLQTPLKVDESELEWVGRIRAVLMVRATLPEFEHVGAENSDEEDQFYKYRSELVDIFKQTLDLPGSKEVVLNDLERYLELLTPDSKPEQIELLLFLLFHFAEKVPDINSLLQSQNQYTTLLENVIKFSFPYKNIVLKMYLENIIRYSTIFKAFPHLLPFALEHLLTNLQNPDLTVRKHVIHMLYRLATKNSTCLLPHVETTLQQIIKSLTQSNLEPESIKELYKTIGLLLGNKDIQKQVQIALCNHLFDTIIATTNPNSALMFTEVLSGFSSTVAPELVPKLFQTIEVVLKLCTELEANNELVKTLCLLIQKIVDTLEQSGCSLIFTGLSHLIKLINMETIEQFFNVISNCCHRLKTNLHSCVPMASLQGLVLQIVRNVPSPIETISNDAQLAVVTRRSLVKVLDTLLETVPDFFNFGEVLELPAYLGSMCCSFGEGVNAKIALRFVREMVEKFCLMVPEHEVSKALILVSLDVSKEILVNKKGVVMGSDVNAAVWELVGLHRALFKVFRNFSNDGWLVKEFAGFIRGADVEGYCNELLRDSKEAQADLKKILISQMEANKSN